ncbi:MAG: 16S rRNA (cytosine(967)-C(5))-methyltransferase RsmB [Desulfosarcinaceae bacterium]|nr:16S rRNA (cytosine(967)-C(5))-methyltransferase RsmB [Desulfosarcinaceae bacterium]
MTMPQDPSGGQADPRRLGLDVLNRLESGHRTLDHLLEDIHRRFPGLGRRDRALLHSLSFGVQRWRGRLDWILAHFAHQRPETLSVPLRNLLRIGLYQICFLDRIPHAAAVNTSVQLAKAIGERRRAGFVNALLRNAARAHQTVPLPDPDAVPDTHLAVSCALPRWLVRRWLKRLGFSQTAALGAALTAQAPITVRTNLLKTIPANLARTLAKEASARFSIYTPLAVRLTSVRRPPAAWPAIQAGTCQVQDEAAQIVGDLLNAQPGETVLDACAGLGGKTGHLAQLMKNHGHLIAADAVPAKLERLARGMRQLGVINVEIRTLDLTHADAMAGLPRFDRILLDAPCSGLGVLRRNPDIKWRRTSKDLPVYQARQQRLLANLATQLKPGGRLVYAVCSMEPEETTAIVDPFLNSHPEFDIDRAVEGLLPAARALMDPRGALVTTPHHHGMDGFFMVALTRLRT